MVKIGDYVVAMLRNKDAVRWGVFVEDNYDGTIVIEGESFMYICFGPDYTVKKVRDKDISPETKKHIQRVRQRLGL